MNTFRFALLVSLLVSGAYAASRAGDAQLETGESTALQANGVEQWLQSGVNADQFTTGSAHFNAEWVFGTAQMAALGYGQQAQTDPARKEEALQRMDRAIDALMSDHGRAFDRGKWREDPLETLGSGKGHAAWLGYTNLALSLHRQLVPDSKWAALNDQLSDAIAARVLAEPSGVFETFPDERYPVDVAAGIASLILHDKVSARDHVAAIAHWQTAFGRDQRHPESGLIYQSTDASALPTDFPRGSGTFLASWFLSFADPTLACDLYADGRTALYERVGPIAGMREYPRGQDGRMDIDSGPIVAGLGVSSTGFAIGAAQACGDELTAAALTTTANWFGIPRDSDGARHWATGAQLGGAPVADAILFAMMSTPPRIQ